jgi:hypothetical protein
VRRLVAIWLLFRVNIGENKGVIETKRILRVRARGGKGRRGRRVHLTSPLSPQPPATSNISDTSHLANLALSVDQLSVGPHTSLVQRAYMHLLIP